MITIPQIITLDIGPLRKNYNHKLGGDSHEGFQKVSHIKEHCAKKTSQLFELDCAAYIYLQIQNNAKRKPSGNGLAPIGFYSNRKDHDDH